MSRVLVSILSNHSIPNFLFFKEMEGKYDEYLFITTPEVDKVGRENQLIKALGVDPNDEGCICVDGNNYQAIIKALKDEWPVRDGDEYIVNLTGGTKMMSLAVHDYFAEKDSQFYYVPIGMNYYYNLRDKEPKPIKYRLNLKEYFTLYGITYESMTERDLNFSKDEAFRIFFAVGRNRYHLTDELIHAQNARTPARRRYLGGEWFEQYTYFALKEALNLDDDSIALSAKIYRNVNDEYNDNELDVCFVYMNVLYVIECKALASLNGKELKLEDYLYKLAAISKDFGLQVKPYLFTPLNIDRMDSKSKQALQKRCRILGVSGIMSCNVISKFKQSILKANNK